MKLLFCSLSALLLISGCASAPPPWYRGFLDPLVDYYDQGTGGGSTIEQADRNAQIALVGFQQGIEIKSITDNEVKSFRRNQDELIVEVATSRGVQQVNGRLPAGSYIAEHWKDDKGYWWSFAVYEKPGRERLIRGLSSGRLQTARLRSAVPGWAQMTKGQQSRGWKIVGLEAGALVGWTTLELLQRDYKNRRDRSRTASRYDYYDQWANRFFWGGMAAGSLAGVTYLYNVLDGLFSVPPSYRLMLSQLSWGIETRHGDHPQLTLYFPLNR